MPSPERTKPLAVSVVIPTHLRETRLAFALEALAAQTLDRDRFEVVVVRSPAVPSGAAVAPSGLDVRFLTAGAASRPGQRNIGWRAARGELIAFTDDDCRPAPEWLERLLEAASTKTLVQGVTEPDPDEIHLLHGLARSVSVREPSPWYPTCNLALSRSMLERLGGFDEEFVDSGEDTDLALRALAAGAEERFAADAVVLHAVLPQPVWQAARSGWARWSTTPLLFKRHPAHRRHLSAGVFFNRSHAALTLFAVGALLARRRPGLVAASLVPYAVLNVEGAGLSPGRLLRRLLHLPAKMIAEGAVAAGLARGAVRYRSPVL